jgi:hypothetical protein
VTRGSSVCRVMLFADMEEHILLALALLFLNMPVGYAVMEFIACSTPSVPLIQVHSISSMKAVVAFISQTLGLKSETHTTSRALSATIS